MFSECFNSSAVSCSQRFWYVVALGFVFHRGPSFWHSFSHWVLLYVYLTVYYFMLQEVHAAEVRRNKERQTDLSGWKCFVHCVKVFLLFSIHHYHPKVHHSRLKIEVNQHQIILLICFTFGKPHTFRSANPYSDSRVTYNWNKDQSWAKQDLCWVYLVSEKMSWAISFSKYKRKGITETAN